MGKGVRVSGACARDVQGKGEKKGGRGLDGGKGMSCMMCRIEMPKKRDRREKFERDVLELYHSLQGAVGLGEKSKTTKTSGAERTNMDRAGRGSGLHKEERETRRGKHQAAVAKIAVLGGGNSLVGKNFRERTSRRRPTRPLNNVRCKMTGRRKKRSLSWVRGLTRSPELSVKGHNVS